MSRYRPRPLSVRQKRLVLTFKPLAHRLALHYANQIGGDREEFECEALHALCRAALAFDPHRKIKFITYAWRTIQWRLWQYVHRHRPRLPMEPQESEEFTYEIVDRRPSAQTIVERQELMDIMEKIIPARERAMLMRMHFDGVSLRKMAKEFGMSRERARQINLESCRQLAQALA